MKHTQRNGKAGFVTNGMAGIRTFSEGRIKTFEFN